MSSKIERMRYQNDSLSFAFCMFALVADIFYFIHMFRNNTLSQGYLIGIDVVINIVFMLIVFLAGENVKNYRRKWAYIVAVIGFIQLARILFLPLHYYNAGELTREKYIYAVVYLTISAFMLFCAAVSCYVKSTLLLRHLKEIGEKA